MRSPKDYGTTTRATKPIDLDDEVEQKQTSVDDDTSNRTKNKKRRITQHLPTARTTSWASLALFSWCKPLADICKKRALRLSDLWELDDKNTSLHCAARFQQAMTQYNSLLRAYCWTQARIMLYSGVVTFFSALCELLSPIAVYKVVDAAAKNEFDGILSNGIIWTVILVASRFLRSYLRTWAMYILMFGKLRGLGALHMLLVRGVLDLVWAPKGISGGSAANLFTIDIAAVGEAFMVCHRLWAVPLELIGLFWIFYQIAGHVIDDILLVSLVIYTLIQLVTWSEASIFKKWLSISDQRFGYLQKALRHILAAKLNTWEEWILGKLMEIRAAERVVLKRYILIRAIRYTLTWIAPSLNLIAMGILLVMVPHFSLMSPAMTFCCVAIFHGINDAFVEAVSVIQTLLQLRVSAHRIQSVLQQQNSRNDSRISPPHMSGNGVDFSNPETIVVVGACFANPSSQDELLMNHVNLRVRKGEFIVVHGKVGCGKSVLLSALIGALPTRFGYAQVRGSIAYCSQEPWIQTMSVRDNILFGKPFDDVKYWNVLDACCLLEDLCALPYGDQTVVGSHGYSSMSSGQRARIALARACYADADIYILDAPLDSVDSIVQCDILLKCMGQLLQKKTIVLATHNPEIIMCEYVDRTILMEDMTLQEGKSNDAQSSARPGKFREKHARRGGFTSKREMLLANTTTFAGGSKKEKRSSLSSSDSTHLRLNPNAPLDPLVRQIQSYSSQASPRSIVDVPVNTASSAYRKKGWRLVLLEYLAYTQSFYHLCVVVVMHLITQVLSTISIYFFSTWIGWCNEANNSPVSKAYMEQLFDRYIWVVGASCVAFLSTTFVTFSCSLFACDKLFQCMTSAILHAPMGFFRANSLGKILNRYARDLTSVDSTLQNVIFTLLKSFSSCFCVCFACVSWLTGHLLSQALHVFHIPSDSLGWMSWCLEVIFNMAVTIVIMDSFWSDGIKSNKPCGEIYLMYRETLSPLFNYVNEIMSGRKVIAAFGAEQRQLVTDVYGIKCDQATRIILAMVSVETWITMRCLLFENAVSASFMVALLVFARATDMSNQPATIGFLIFLLLNIRDDLRNSFANWNLLEKDLACVQRVLEYIDIEAEGKRNQSSNMMQSMQIVDPFWPRTGSITFNSVYFQYDDGVRFGAGGCGDTAMRESPGYKERAMPLKNVSFKIAAGEKIGVVGRSGAGKSSLAMALMRVNDPVRGTIQIDGVDVMQLHLKTLRSKIAYVPPNPVFGRCTLREYLDQSGQVDDETLWKTLRKTGAEVSIRKMNGMLDSSLDGVVRWSSGERQLLCLSRALLYRSRIVILDEATTSTDQDTDYRIQHVMLNELLDPTTTLLCISHRLDSVLEFDKVLVMADGQVADFGTVPELIASGDGMFMTLLENSQLVY